MFIYQKNKKRAFELCDDRSTRKANGVPKSRDEDFDHLTNAANRMRHNF